MGVNRVGPPLHVAAYEGQLIVAEFLLTNGADVGAKLENGRTPLHEAALSGHKSMVELLLNHQAKIQAVDNDGDTPLHLAAAHGYRSVVEVLLAHGAEVNAAMPYRPTPLLTAVAHDFQSVAELLLVHGADVNASTSDVRPYGGAAALTGTALDVAVSRGNQAMVELLLTNKADLTAADYSGDGPLAIAAAKGDLVIAGALLSHGADVNAKNAGKEHPGWTPLHWAVEHNQKDMVALLLKHKADPNARIENSYGEGGTGYTPLLMATARVLPDIVDLLLASNADANLRNDTRTPILNVMNNEDPVARLQMLKSLLQHGVALEARDAKGSTPLLMAAWRADRDATALLLANKANVNARDKDDNTPLLVAVKQGQLALTELLLAHQADVNAASFNGWTPLHQAAADGRKAIAELLLKAGADVNLKAGAAMNVTYNNDKGYTPLHVAVDHKQQELAELLLANKADPNARNDAGQTPLDLAKSQAQSAPGLPPGATRLLPGMALPLPMRLPGSQPLNITLQTPGAQAAGSQQESKPETMVDLLRQHGAVDDLPRLDAIEVRRGTTRVNSPFAKRAHDWSQFTLLELIAVECDFLAGSPSGDRSSGGFGDGFGSSGFAASAFFSHSMLFPFPDLAHLHIRRPAADLKSWKEQVLDLRPVLEAGDCSKDVRLEWGDVVEIPEADHPLHEKWPGFSRIELANLKKCLTRQVEIVVNGQATNITVAPKISDLEATPPMEPIIDAHTPFWLQPVLLQSKLVLTSSDLSRVKVTRRDPASGQKREWVVDCSESSPAPDFWLRDGDKIEVPEKTDGTAGEATAVSPAGPGVALPTPAPAGQQPH
jgi:ankyrin repeat protein